MYSQFAQLIRSRLSFRHQKHVQYELVQEALENQRDKLELLEAAERESRRLEQALERGGRISSTSPNAAGSPPTLERSLPAENEAAVPRPAPRRAQASFGLLSAVKHSLSGMMDVDPESTRRTNIGKTRDNISQVSYNGPPELSSRGSSKTRCRHRPRISSTPRPRYRPTLTASSAKRSPTCASLPSSCPLCTRNGVARTLRHGRPRRQPSARSRTTPTHPHPALFPHATQPLTSRPAWTENCPLFPTLRRPAHLSLPAPSAGMVLVPRPSPARFAWVPPPPCRPPHHPTYPHPHSRAIPSRPLTNRARTLSVAPPRPRRTATQTQSRLRPLPPRRRLQSRRCRRLHLSLQSPPWRRLRLPRRHQLPLPRRLLHLRLSLSRTTRLTTAQVPWVPYRRWTERG